MERTLLKNIMQGGVCVIEQIAGLEQAVHKRLIEMGFVKNAKVSVIKNKPKAKLMLISIRGYLLSLDYNLAQKVQVVV